MQHPKAGQNTQLPLFLWAGLQRFKSYWTPNHKMYNVYFILISWICPSPESNQSDENSDDLGLGSQEGGRTDSIIIFKFCKCVPDL